MALGSWPWGQVYTIDSADKLLFLRTTELTQDRISREEAGSFREIRGSVNGRQRARGGFSAESTIHFSHSSVTRKTSGI